MWEEGNIESYIKEKCNGEDIWNSKIKPMIRKIIIWSLESVQDSVAHRNKSCELFGYDLMIDADYNPWLIEINSSPAMDYSTPVTEKLVKLVCEDTIKVIVDYYMAPKKKKKEIDTGLFKKIYKAKKAIDKPLQFGLNLVCEGKKIKI